MKKKQEKLEKQKEQKRDQEAEIMARVIRLVLSWEDEETEKKEKDGQ